ncbi:caspase a-like [Acanthochromis polyacanthus]|uniref:caspase a-like n=1 Tax=Acanthochromis polyacanthus TaxID=80966 RepID=UPI0022342690|nr:caspase a-like [Acanthochromis polyacanthus]
MAARELARVRTKFVEKVSKDMISQLLDDLLDDRVLNDGEKDSILEENVKTRDKARALLDRVKHKGDEASRKMIAHLYERDQTLCSELGLSCSQPPQQAAQVKMKTEWSTTLVHATDAFWNEKQKDPNIYPVEEKSIANRVALLITNIKFANERLNRNGAERDEENMEKLLSDLKYEVVKYRNLTAKEIGDALIQFSRHPKLRETDSVVVVIMSHGKLGAVLGVNCEDEMSADIFPIDNIYQHLGSEKCPALLNKPKIIIIQACRGGGKGAVLVSDSANQGLVCDDVSQPGAEGGMEEDNLRYVHKEKDFISLLSSTPDTVSYRHTVFGSVLIQYIVEVFNTFANTDDILELFRKVMQRSEDFVDGNRRQMPTIDRVSTTKRFYFFPGH